MLNNKAVKFVKEYWVLFLLIILKIILQFIYVNPVYELHRDEFLYLDQAFHPATGFISVPPLTSWISSLIYLLGGGIFWIRLFPALFGAITLVFAWLIVEELGGKLSAKIITAVFFIFSVYARLNILFQPNSFDILIWTAIFYLFIKYINSEQNKWLLLMAVAIALGFYNKYNVLFLITGLFIAIALTKHKILFAKKELYIAFFLCLALLLPNIIYQVKNDFPVIHHMKALNDSQLVNIKPTDFLLDQLKFGLIGILTIAAFWGLIFFKQLEKYRFILLTYIFTITFYALSRAKNYYALGLYPVLFAVGSVYIEKKFEKWKNLIFVITGTLNIVAFFAIVNYLMPFQTPEKIIENRVIYERIGLLRWEDGKNHPLPQDFADMLGWREIADKAFEAYKLIPEDELNNTIVYCDNYGQTGALNYYNRNKMPEAFSFNTDYIYWIPKNRTIKNIVFVGEIPANEVVNMFDTIKIVGVIENQYAREKGTKIFLMLGANELVTQFFYNLIEERKKKYLIF